MAHTYWRIYEVSPTGGGLAIGQISMAATIGGSNQCVGGTATASSQYGGYAPSNSFDGNPSDFWSSNGGDVGEWIAYQFPSPVDVLELVIFPRPDYLADKQGLRLFNLDYSDDGTTWTTFANWYAATWNAGTSQTFDVIGGNATVISTTIEALTSLGAASNATVACTFIEILTPIYTPTPPTPVLNGGWVSVIQ